jgi:hypothetical protein
LGRAWAVPDQVSVVWVTPGQPTQAPNFSTSSPPHHQPSSVIRVLLGLQFPRTAVRECHTLWPYQQKCCSGGWTSEIKVLVVSDLPSGGHEGHCMPLASFLLVAEDP